MKNIIFALCTFFGILGFHDQLYAQNTMNNYEKEWKEIEEFDAKQLPKSALEKVEALYARAKNEGNTSQSLKALIYRTRYTTELSEEEGFASAIEAFRKEEETATFPTKNILQSMLGEIYGNYLQNNYYALRNRTATDSTFKREDIRTWDMARLQEEADTRYLQSVGDADRLKAVKITDFTAITESGENTDKARPTLYEFLSFRAISHFINERNYLNEPAYQFYIDRVEYFASAAEFAYLSIDTKDQTSRKYHALILLQDMTKAHLNDAEPDALIETELNRLEFIKNNATLEDKQDRYIFALTALLKKYENTPYMVQISYRIAQEYYNKSQRNKDEEIDYEEEGEDNGTPTSINKLDDKALLVKAKDLCEKAIKRYPTAWGANACESLINSILSTTLNIRTEKVNAANRPILAVIEARNLENLYFKVISLPAVVLEKDDADNEERYDQNKYWKRLNNIPARQSWSHRFPDDKDFSRHSAEVAVSGLPYGRYVVAVSNSEKFDVDTKGVKVSFAEFLVSDMGYWSESEGVNNSIIVYNRTTGQPLKGVTAEFFGQKYDDKKRRYVYPKINNAVSDENGFIPFSLKGEEGRNYYLKLTNGNDVFFFPEGNYNYGYYRNDDEVEDATSVNFFLDRAIYRPSQTVFFKGIATKYKGEKDGNRRLPEVLPNYQVEVEFKDANDQKISSQILTTNEYGTFNGSFTAPASGLLGYMSIQCKNGSIGVRVEEYKRPKYEASFKPLTDAVQVDKPVTVVGLAKAFAGSFVDGAKVTYRVRRQVRYPYWCYWWGVQPSGGNQEIAKGETTTDTKGEFKITFNALPDRSVLPSTKPVFTYTISADVVDINGETHSTTTSVSVGYIGLNIGVAVPDLINRREAKPISIFVNNLNGQPQSNQKVKASIDLLASPQNTFVNRFWKKPDTAILSKKEFEDKFPNYAYRNEDEVQNWAKKERVYQEVLVSDDKGAKIDLKDLTKGWQAGSYRLTISVVDSLSGENLEQVRFFTIYDLKDKIVPTNQFSFHLLDGIKFQPNDIAPLYIGTAAEQIMVFFELAKDGKTLQKQWLTIKGLEKIEIPIQEKDRGNLYYRLSYAYKGRVQQIANTIAVPWDNKDLKIDYSTFRDKLLPGQDEEWILKISGNKKEKVAAEILVSMYDASLDQFAANRWDFSPFPTSSGFLSSRNMPFYSSGNVTNWGQDKLSDKIKENNHSYRGLNWFGFSFGSYYYRSRMAGGMPMPTMSAPMKAMARKEKNSDREEAVDVLMAASEAPAAADKAEPIPRDTGAPPPPPAPPTDGDGKNTDFGSVKVRTNLNETVFFYPELRTDAEGNIYVQFKMNEALTKWKFQGLAITKDLQTAVTEREIVTQKDLMVFPNPPRFVREGDVMEFSAKITNLSSDNLNGEARLELFDALTMKTVDNLLDNSKNITSFSTKTGESARVSWKIQVPYNKVEALTWRIVAKSGNFSDGEESTLPILTNSMLVTEALPLPVRGGETKEFKFESLKNSVGSTTLQPHKFTLEFTQNPAWYAVQALPYLIEYPYECTEQLFSRYFANSLATSVANSHPKVKAVFERWKNYDVSALKSNLAKNEELKSALLEETPWVLASQSEEVQKKNIGLLFDLNRMANEQNKAIGKIKDRQNATGGFVWFTGGRDDWYITQYLVEGFGHLNKLGVKNIKEDKQLAEMLEKAVRYCDDEIVKYYEEIERRVKKGEDKWEDDHANYMVVHYLYARSFYPELKIRNSKVADYFKGQAAKYWTGKGNYSQGLIALAQHRDGKTDKAKEIIKSLKERSQNNAEMGMYWKQDYGYYWYQMPIETQSLMIEAFLEVTNDTKAVDDLKTWLLKNKQTNAWSTTKGTASAVYALLMNGDNWLLEDKEIGIYLNGKALDQSKIKKEAGTGYFKTDWAKTDVKPEMGNIKVVNPNKVVAWGAAYFQYFEQLDKIKTFKETPLTIKKDVLKVTNGDRGQVLTSITPETPLQMGDRVRVRIEIRVDREMEYVHLKDMRASSFEPVSATSQYRYQNGLGYYESPRDASMNFFFGYLPKGTHVFEYDLLANQKGEFSNGITTMQCMYAPEFTSHSQGIRIKVE